MKEIHVLKKFLFALVVFVVSCSAMRRPQALVIADDAAVPAHTVKGADLPMDPTEFMSIIEGDIEHHEKPSCAKGDTKCVPHYLLGEIKESTAKDAITFLKEADEAKPSRIMIEINSPGGTIDDGFKLIRAIEETKSKIVCVVDGDGESMAYFTLQSCPVRVMTARSTLMTHKALFETISPATIDVIKSALADLEARSDALAFQGQRRLKISMKDYKAKVEGTNWFMSEVEAFNVGAVDCVFAGSATEARKQLATKGTLTCAKGTATPKK